MRCSCYGLVLLAVSVAGSPGLVQAFEETAPQAPSAAAKTRVSEFAFSQLPTAKRVRGGYQVEFSVSRATDVEVAILDGQGRVVRHLAAGMLGAEIASPAPLQPGLAQSLLWDGQDDYGVAATGGPFQARVRAGMGVQLENIVGGDPDTWFSLEVGQDNHAGWLFGGLEAKPDGSVYLIGNVNFYGPAAVRCYDAAGNYQRTVYPPPAGRSANQMQGWGISTREDGSYVFKHHNLDSSAITNTGISGHRASLATLIPTTDKDKLRFIDGSARRFTGQIIEVNTDGTIPADPHALGPLVKTPAVPDDSGEMLRGNPFIAYTPSGKHFYLSGVFSDTGISYQRGKQVLTSGFWRDGQVYKVDAESGKAEVFYALDEKSLVAELSKRHKALGDSVTSTYSSLHGVAVDGQGRVFVCDRLNNRVSVLDSTGKQVRQLTVDAPDAIALDPASPALYVTSRRGDYHHRQPSFRLLKFANWEEDTEPTVETVIAPRQPVGVYQGRTHLAAARNNGKTFLWLAFISLPVHVYEDRGSELTLVKDFYEAGRQRATDLEHMVVDPRTEQVYVHGSFGNLFAIDDWSQPELRRCRIEGDQPGKHQESMALGFAMDPRTEYFYLRKDREPVKRFKRHNGEFVAAPIGDTGSNVVTPTTSNDWRINLGLGERGMAVAPDGGLATLVAFGKNDYSGPLSFFPANETQNPWDRIEFESFGAKPKSAGVRFDSAGNLYAGYHTTDRTLPEELNWAKESLGKIVKYAPTGRLQSGNLFPHAPREPAKIYDVPYGSISPGFARTSFFGVDGWGRIYYPTSLLCRFTVMDNEGNEILRCGTYGNRDSKGGLEGDLVPTNGVPMAYPNSVDATDDYIYVSDIVNVRLLRLKKTFKLAVTTGI